MKSKRNSGFTLVETLAAVGILVILLAVSAVAVVRHVNTLKITELDNAAREIFMSAENRAVLLSAAQQLNTLVDPTAGSGVGKATTLHNVGNANSNPHYGKNYEQLYYVSSDSIYDLLTYGGIDRTLLDNGEFYIVYDLNSGSVTDVFYAEKTRDDKEPLTTLITKYRDFAAFYSDWAAARSARLGKDVLMGWYNGEAAQGQGTAFTPTSKERPVVTVMINNGEELTVTVTVEVKDSKDIDQVEAGTIEVFLGPAVSGIVLTEGNSIPLTGEGPQLRSSGWEIIGKTRTCTWVLDSLTETRGLSDGTTVKLRFDTLGLSEAYEDFAPGDKFKVVATFTPAADSTLKEASAYDTNNSLFAKESMDGTACIAYLRHLQNLDADGGYGSGVGSNITSAKQVANVLGEGYPDKSDQTYYTGYEDYEFIPIVNSNLSKYNGGSYEIQNLNLLAASGASVGLFSETRAAGMSFSDIRMVNTTMTGEASLVGALAGKTSGAATITNCWVYWDENRLPEGTLAGTNGVLVDSAGDLQYQLKGATVGGLVGQANGTTTITKSLAATLIRGSASAGGLVGRVDAGALSVTIENSYADCYLYGPTTTENETTTIANAAGLIGSLNAPAELTNCYAAGFIVGENSAGLCLGGGTTTATNVYSAMLKIDDKKVAKLSSLTGKDGEDLSSGSSSNVHFLGSGSANGVRGQSSAKMSTQSNDSTKDFAKIMNGEAFTWTSTTDAPTNAYGLLDEELEEYLYPVLKGLPHYGDWGALSTLQVVYWEDYGEKIDGKANLGVWGVDTSGGPVTVNYKKNLGSNETIVTDGYAVVFSPDAIMKSTGGYCDKVTVTYYYYNSEDVVGESGSVEVKNLARTSWGTNEGEQLNYILPLPDKLLVEAASAPGSTFYRYLRFELYDADGDVHTLIDEGECYFNPHFPEMVQLYADEAKDPTTINIRTPRHLYHLGQYAAYYHHGNGNNAGYTFNQVFDLDYTTYTGYRFLGGAGSLPAQTPIGRADSVNPTNGTVTTGGNDGKNVSFNGTYNGNKKTIDNLKLNGSSSPNNNFCGLFGYSTGTITGVNLATTCTVTGGDFVGGIVGYNADTLGEENSPNINSAPVTGKTNVGGIAGGNSATVDGTYNIANSITVKGQTNVGGFVGHNSGTVKNCTRTGSITISVTGDAPESIGGIVGLSVDGCIEYCVNDAELNVTAENVGGIAGRIVSTKVDTTEESAVRSTVQISYNAGKVTVTGEDVGGIVGQSEGGIVQHCYNTGYVKGTDFVGGILGSSRGDYQSEILYCYVDGSSAIPDNPTQVFNQIVEAKGMGATHYGSFVGSCKFQLDDSMINTENKDKNGKSQFDKSFLVELRDGRIGGKEGDTINAPTGTKSQSGYHYESSSPYTITTGHSGIAVTVITRSFYRGAKGGPNTGSGVRTANILFVNNVPGAAMNSTDTTKRWAWLGSSQDGRLVLEGVGEGKYLAWKTTRKDDSPSFTADVFSTAATATYTVTVTLRDEVPLGGTWKVVQNNENSGNKIITEVKSNGNSGKTYTLAVTVDNSQLPAKKAVTDADGNATGEYTLPDPVTEVVQYTVNGETYYGSITINFDGFVGLVIYGGGSSADPKNLNYSDLTPSILYIRHLTKSDGNPYKDFEKWSNGLSLKYEFTEFTITKSNTKYNVGLKSAVVTVGTDGVVRVDITIPSGFTLNKGETASLTVTYKVTYKDYPVTKTETIGLYRP